MSLPTVTQTWTMSFNNRYRMGTSAGSLSTIMLSVKNFLKTTMGYTVKGSCNGVTGAMDGVDRWSVAADAATRFNGTGGAQSWVVLTDGSGVDWLFTYNATKDDWYKVATSPGGNYIAAGTPAQQPTAASDEYFHSEGNGTLTGTSTQDRVWHLWSTTDKKMFRVVICKAGLFQSFFAGEKLTSAIVSPATFTLSAGGGTAVVVNRYEKGADTIGGVGYSLTTYLNADYSMASGGGALARVHTPGGGDGQAQACRTGEMPGGAVGCALGFSGFYNNDYPRLQGSKGYLLFPSRLGSRTTNWDGKIGTLFDDWYFITASNGVPLVFTMLGDKQFWVFHPGMMLPGDGVTVLQER